MGLYAPGIKEVALLLTFHFGTKKKNVARNYTLPSERGRQKWPNYLSSLQFPVTTLHKKDIFT